MKRKRKTVFAAGSEKERERIGSEIKRKIRLNVRGNVV